jgi:integrase
MDKTETEALIAKAKESGPVVWLVCDMALQTGLRVSELVKIQIEDIDFKRGLVMIERNKKTKKVREPLPMANSLFQHIRKTLKAEKRHSGPLFVGQRGPLTKRGLQQIWDAAIRRAGLPKGLSIHCARHTLATHMMSKTGNLRLVQKQLGHSSPATTANMYADVLFSDHQGALNDMFG